MDWSKVAEVALSILVAAGGLGAVIVGVIKWSSNIIAEKLSKKYQLQLDKDIEKYKADLSKKEYVSKTRFDAEFSIYRELTAAFSQLIIDISTLIPYGIYDVPVDEVEREKVELDNYIKAHKSLVEAQKVLFSNKAFIQKSFCDKYHEMLNLSNLQIDAYMRRYNVSIVEKDQKSIKTEDFKRTKELQDKWNEHVDAIRDYLSTLDVIS